LIFFSHVPILKNSFAFSNDREIQLWKLCFFLFLSLLLLNLRYSILRLLNMVSCSYWYKVPLPLSSGSKPLIKVTTCHNTERKNWNFNAVGT
jgi:hypothetical protein